MVIVVVSHPSPSQTLFPDIDWTLDPSGGDRPLDRRHTPTTPFACLPFPYGWSGHGRQPSVAGETSLPPTPGQTAFPTDIVGALAYPPTFPHPGRLPGRPLQRRQVEPHCLHHTAWSSSGGLPHLWYFVCISLLPWAFPWWLNFQADIVERCVGAAGAGQAEPCLPFLSLELLPTPFQTFGREGLELT